MKRDFHFSSSENTAELLIEETIEVIAQSSNRIIMLCTKEGLIKNITSNSQELLEYNKDEMIGQKLHNYIPEKDFKGLQKLCSPFIEQKQEIKHTFRFRKKTNSLIWLEAKVRLLKDPYNQDLQAFLFIIKELISENEETLLQKSDKLSVIGQLAAGVVHEIRNPLTSLKGFIQLMKSDKKYNAEYLQIMESEIEHIDSISQELMILAKPNEASFNPCDLMKIFETCLRLLEGQLFQKRIKVVSRMPRYPVLVYGDEQKIKQVYLNLMKNAIEAMDHPGKITVHIAAEGNKGLFSITDEGSGIPEEMIGKLGQPFFTTKSNGNGLGLMICYKIIEEHHGEIQVESKVGAGSTFRVTLPLLEDEIHVPEAR